MLLISWFPLSVRTSVPTNYRYGTYQAVLRCTEHSDWCTTHTSSLSNWYVLFVPSGIPWYDDLDWFIIGCLLGRYSMFQFFWKKIEEFHLCEKSKFPLFLWPWLIFLYLSCDLLTCFWGWICGFLLFIAMYKLMNLF